MNIFLIGYMGSGKTTVGRRLAKQLNYEFVDVDQLFEERFRLSISAFFEKYDEAAFRQIEKELIEELSKELNLVISTGGGAPCFFDNLEVMKNSGIVVYLQMAVKSLSDRLSHAKKIRPILKNLSGEGLVTFIQNQLSDREVFYKQANISVKGESINIDTLANTIRPLLSSK